MTSPTDVQNMPDVWALLEEAQQWFRLDLNMPTPEYAEFQAFGKLYLEALAQRNRWQLVPKEPTEEMLEALERAYAPAEGTSMQAYAAALSAAPKPEGKL